MKKNLIFLSLSILAMLFFLSCDNEVIKPGFTHLPGGKEIPKFSSEVMVIEQEITQIYEAVGTIRPLTESIIESQTSAQVVTVNISPGAIIKKGQLLITLDSRRSHTQLKQAKEGLIVAQNNLKQVHKAMDEARAGLDQAKAEYKRTEKLFETNIVTTQKLEADKAVFLMAKARLEKTQESEQAAKASIRKAREVVKESEIRLGFTQIKAPADGIVVKRTVDPGDIAVPGKPLLTLQTSGALRLEARVREGMIDRIHIGNNYKVRIGTIDKIVLSQIEEIIPYADPNTRTFLVKASLSASTGIYPGMFGRLQIPMKKKKTLLIPIKAVTRVGQLEMVYVKQDQVWKSVFIKTGKQFEDNIEILAGLSGKEMIGY